MTANELKLIAMFACFLIGIIASERARRKEIADGTAD